MSSCKWFLSSRKKRFGSVENSCCAWWRRNNDFTSSSCSGVGTLLSAFAFKSCRPSKAAARGWSAGLKDSSQEKIILTLIRCHMGNQAQHPLLPTMPSVDFFGQLLTNNINDRCCHLMGEDRTILLCQTQAHWKRFSSERNGKKQI